MLCNIRYAWLCEQLLHQVQCRQLRMFAVCRTSTWFIFTLVASNLHQETKWIVHLLVSWLFVTIYLIAYIDLLNTSKGSSVKVQYSLCYLQNSPCYWLICIRTFYSTNVLKYVCAPQYQNRVVKCLRDKYINHIYIAVGLFTITTIHGNVHISLDPFLIPT